MYARIINNSIAQLVNDYNNCLGDNFVKIPKEIAGNIEDYVYKDGEWIYYPRIIIPTIQEIDAQVVQKIRERYDENEEYKMLRLGILDSTNVDFLAYNTYVEECRAWGQSEKQKYGLIE